MSKFLQHQQNPLHFIVHKKQVDKKKILRSSILLDKVDLAIDQTISNYKHMLIENPKSIDFNFLKQAYLDDQLIVKNRIKKLTKTELELDIVVLKQQKNHHDIICKASIGYVFKKAS
ncbi:hypothetical protein GCM10011416_22290 [Polaribacter pacificus]|uniref:Uncharacterized protein n=1 Tax=Polaribacter pacificus TaxID=1775173 RepID=A0A917MF76_9FLAO|nr:hypothetical protein [Polaribacter pacificus]GGH02980.1 hypothetical protein GCM10011416_22290 [Polaribacter pacificus]